jgi:hypothetical protein
MAKDYQNEHGNDTKIFKTAKSYIISCFSYGKRQKTLQKMPIYRLNFIDNLDLEKVNLYTRGGNDGAAAVINRLAV